MKFRVFKSDKNKQWYWHLKLGREIVAQSEGYKNRLDCISTVKSIQAKAGAAEIEIVPTKKSVTKKPSKMKIVKAKPAKPKPKKKPTKKK